MGIAKDGPPPGEDQLSLLAVIGQSGPRRMETPRQDALERWADYIYRWLTGGRLQMTRIHELLAARGCPVSYPSLRRFLVKRNWRRAGLCHSRHCFLWPMRQQKLEDVIAGWRRPGPSSTG